MLLEEVYRGLLCNICAGCLVTSLQEVSALGCSPKNSSEICVCFMMLWDRGRGSSASSSSFFNQPTRVLFSNWSWVINPRQSIKDGCQIKVNNRNKHNTDLVPVKIIINILILCSVWVGETRHPLVQIFSNCETGELKGEWGGKDVHADVLKTTGSYLL